MKPINFMWLVGAILLIIAIIVATIVDDLMWIVPFAAIYAVYWAASYFGNQVEPEQVGMVAFGGKPTNHCQGGYVLAPKPFYQIWLERWRMQYIFHPGPHGHTAASVMCTLRPINFVAGKKGSKDPYERQITLTPTLAMMVHVNKDGVETFFEEAESHLLAADLICEEINAALLEECSKKTLRYFIEHLHDIEKSVTKRVNDFLNGLGLKMVACGGHHNPHVQIVNAGIPQTVVEEEQRAMVATAQIATNIAGAEAKKEEAVGTKAEEEAKVAGELALADKEKELATTYADKLGKEGAARVLAGKELAEGLPRGATTIIIGGGGNMPGLLLDTKGSGGGQQQKPKGKGGK